VEGYLVNRAVACVLLCVIAAQADAQTAAPSAKAAQAQKGAAAKPAAKPTTNDSMPLADRLAIQTDLIWTGDFNGLANGEWGDRTTNAVKTFQKRKGGKDTGTLTPEERAALSTEAKAKQDDVGWKLVADDNGTQVGVPLKLMPRASKGKSGGHWQSNKGEVQIDLFREPAPATLAVVYDQERKNPGRKVDYNVIKPDFFVISGLQGLKKFYIRANAGGGEVRGVTVLYDQAMEGIMEPIVVAISSAFTPFPSATQVAGALVKRKVEYATGVVVSSAGDIVTDREVLDGCQVIVASGLGNAERIADDKASGLGLVRVYGAHDLKPLALGDAPRTDVTLVGIADPQTQAGNATISTTKARVVASGDTSTLDPAAALGFSGAAAIDAEAGFVGVVVQRPQVVAGPPTNGGASAIASAGAVRKLLLVQKLTPASGKESVEFAKDSVVRLICVRK
jgi:peptidoglycan hydrolase-like protein with peptidoglycan-binding domain